MPDLTTREVTRKSPGNLNTPTWEIAAVVAQDGITVANFTGANVIRFPQVLSLLSQADQDEIVDQMANLIIYKLAAQGGG